MKRIVGSLIGLAVVLAVLASPVLAWNLSFGDPGYEPTSISDYVADFTIDGDGDLTVVETLTVSFPGSDKHGIFRFFDRVDPAAEDKRREPDDISVTRDGANEPFEVLEEQHGRLTNVKIGSADTFISAGDHVYTIRYTIEDVIEPGQEVDAESQFYWNLVPSGWQQDIARSELTVNLPAASSTDVQCAVGVGETGGCEVEGAGTRTLVVRTGPLDDHTPVTIKTGVDMPTPDDGETVPWPARWDRVLSTSPVLLGLVLLAALGAGLVGATLGARSREKPPAFPLQYAPPEGIGPAQAAYVLTEKTDNTAYVATLMHAAEKGAISLDRNGDSWTITDLNAPDSPTNKWSGLDEVTVGAAHILSGPGSSFTASRTSVSAGERLRTELSSFADDVKGWARSSGNVVPSGLGGFGGLLVLACFALVVVAAIWNPFDMTMVGLVPGAFAVGGASLMATGSGTSRTRKGRDLWSRVGGFHRVLSTPSSKERFDFSGREELYTAYVPWAVALGCAQEWAAKYRSEVGAEPPVPAYWGGYAGAHTADHVDSMVSDFSSTVDSAISAYNATQTSSSSGGGGGFSGGGGGGGGGGGSW
ncbi:DUF2207 domain-containing protein [Nocardioides sp. SYSU D00038]|uniref:DUF2207 domain-containing protein n=1 Tax=Nocardioides sp. SYSU D00038 TaxID=2812554 RepID=UPI001967765C|nr:DUF2207 domain-containing protein [Nocardioides sp. SYSU D00038]